MRITYFNKSVSKLSFPESFYRPGLRYIYDMAVSESLSASRSAKYISMRICNSIMWVKRVYTAM